MSDVRACPELATLRNLVLGQVSSAERVNLNRHLQQCGACAEIVVRLGGPGPGAATIPLPAGTATRASHDAGSLGGPGRWKRARSTAEAGATVLADTPPPIPVSPAPAGGETDSAAAGSNADRPAATCPRCGAARSGTLVREWCLSCGYYGRQEEATPALPVRQGVPRWAWVLLGGVLAILVLSIAGDLLLGTHLMKGRARVRAWWSAGQAGSGILVLIAAEIWAAAILVPKSTETRFSFLGLAFPVRLWVNAFNALPLTLRPVYLGSWSLTAVVCAVLVIGGHSYWFKGLVPSKKENTTIVSLARVHKGDSLDENLEAAVKDLAEKVDIADMELTDLDEKDEDEPAPPGERFTAECVVIGYVRAKDGTVTGVVVAARHGEALTFAGLIDIGLDPATRQEAGKHLAASKKRSRPPVKVGDLKAVWVAPKDVCSIDYASIHDGVFQKPAFKQWVKKDKPAGATAAGKEGGTPSAAGAHRVP